LYLDRILREKKNVSELASLHTIAKNYFNLYILQRYERLLEKNGRLGKLSEEEYREVWSLLTEATTLYAKVDGDDAYKNFVLDELSKERLMRYFDLGDEEVMTHLQCEKLGLDPLNLVVQLRSRNPTDEHLQAEHLMYTTVYNRRKDWEAYYESEFHRVKRRNELDEDRLRMVELIDRFYTGFLITKDKSFLDIPYHEYVLNIGRIRWGRALLPSLSHRRPVLFVQHWRNANLAQFSFRLERRKIYQAYKEKSWTDWLRWW
ncbi:MAG: hypothetical protein AAFQ37_09295, partial [Bacteroidota bacterium]